MSTGCYHLHCCMCCEARDKFSNCRPRLFWGKRRKYIIGDSPRHILDVASRRWCYSSQMEWPSTGHLTDGHMVGSDWDDRLSLPRLDFASSSALTPMFAVFATRRFKRYTRRDWSSFTAFAAYHKAYFAARALWKSRPDRFLYPHELPVINPRN